jgi:glycosyltransferase involved in cell wall biosynthesis
MGTRRLLLIADAFYPRDLPPECKTNAYLATALGKRGWAVSLWATRGARIPPGSINVTLVRTPRSWGLLECIRIFVWLALNRPEKAILMYHAELYSYKAYINLLPVMARLAGVRSVTLFTSSVRPRRSAIQDKLLGLFGYHELLKYPIGILGSSNRMIFYCDQNRNRLLGADPCNLKAQSTICSPPNTLPVDNRTDKVAIRASIGLADNDFLVGYFGLIYPEKGIEWLLEAMRIIRDKAPTAKLILVGPSGAVTSNKQWNLQCQKYEELLRRKADALAITDTVIWSGYCTDLKAVEFLSSCDVICLPFDGGLTNQRSSFITCAQIGLPVITTMTSATDEFLRSPESGVIYVEPCNPSQIAETLVGLHDDREVLERSAFMLKRFAARHYSNELFVECFEVA